MTCEKKIQKKKIQKKKGHVVQKNKTLKKKKKIKLKYQKKKKNNKIKKKIEYNKLDESFVALQCANLETLNIERQQWTIHQRLPIKTDQQSAFFIKHGVPTVVKSIRFLFFFWLFFCLSDCNMSQVCV